MSQMALDVLAARADARFVSHRTNSRVAEAKSRPAARS